MSKELIRMQELAGISINEEDTNDPVSIYLRGIQKDIMNLVLVTNRFYKAWTDDPTPGSLTRFDKQEGGRIEGQPSWKVAMERFTGKDMYNYLLFKVSEMSNGLDLDKGNLDKYLDGVLDEILRRTKGDFNREALIKEFPNSANYIGQLGSGNVQKDKDILARLLTVDNSLLTSGGYGNVLKLKSDKELYKDFKDGTLFSSSFGNISTVSEEKNKTNKMNKEFTRMQKLAGVKLQENYELDEAAAENLELKSFTKQLFSFAKKEGAQAFLVDYSKQENTKTLGAAVKDQTKPSVFISINPGGNVSVRMVGAGVDQLYKDMVNSYSKFEFGEYKYTDKLPFPPYTGAIPSVTFTVKSKTTGKKGGVMATESLNEHQIGGIVGVGAINQIPPREKSDYEMAFEHFMTEGEEKEVEEGVYEEDDMKESYYEEDDTMEEAVGIPAEASAIRDAVRKMMKDHEGDAELGAAVREKFAK
jgi:hypothetical protein